MKWRKLWEILAGAEAILVASSIGANAASPVVRVEAFTGAHSSLGTNTSDGAWSEGIIPATFFHPEAAYYIVGSSSDELLEFWQPFGELEGGLSIAAVHLDVAKDLVQTMADTGNAMAIKVVNAGWDNVANQEICTNESPDCPALIMLGTTQVATRFESGITEPLTDYLNEWAQENGYTLTDDFSKSYFYDFNMKGVWTAVPLVTDTRIMFYNATTFNALNLTHPPPWGDWGENSEEWTWVRFSETAQLISEGTGQPGFHAATSWDEELKLSMMIAREYGAYMYTEDEDGIKHCALNDNGKFVEAINATLGPLFSKGAISDFVNTTDHNFDSWKSEWAEGRETSDFNGIMYSGLSLCAHPLYGMAIDTPHRRNDFLDEDAIHEAYVPSKRSFLGGSGLILNSKAAPKQKDAAWTFLSRMCKRASDYGRVVFSPPPFESLLTQDPWMDEYWAITVEQLKTSVPPQYPLLALAELGRLEVVKPFRQMWMEMAYQNVSVEVAAQHACATMDQVFSVECTEQEHSHHTCEICDEDSIAVSLSPCDEDQKQVVQFSWAAEPKTCVGGVSLPPAAVVFCDHVVPSSIIGSSIITLSAGAGILSLAFLIFVLMNRRDNMLMRQAQPIFCILFTGGIVCLTCVSNIFLLGPASRFSCQARLWIWGLSFDVAFGALFAKAWRAYIILDSARRFQRKRVSTMLTTTIAGAVVFFDVLLLTAWIVTTPIEPIPYTINVHSMALDRMKCASRGDSTTFEVCFWVYKLVLIISGCQISYAARNYSSDYVESKGIMLSMWNFLLLLLLLMVTQFGGLVVHYAALMRCLVMTVGGSFSLLAVLGPRVWKMRQANRNPYDSSADPQGVGGGFDSATSQRYRSGNHDPSLAAISVMPGLPGVPGVMAFVDPQERFSRTGVLEGGRAAGKVAACPKCPYCGSGSGGKSVREEEATFGVGEQQSPPCMALRAGDVVNAADEGGRDVDLRQRNKSVSHDESRWGISSDDEDEVGEGVWRGSVRRSEVGPTEEEDEGNRNSAQHSPPARGAGGQVPSISVPVRVTSPILRRRHGEAAAAAAAVGDTVAGAAAGAGAVVAAAGSSSEEGGNGGGGREEGGVLSAGTTPKETSPERGPERGPAFGGDCQHNVSRVGATQVEGSMGEAVSPTSKDGDAPPAAGGQVTRQEEDPRAAQVRHHFLPSDSFVGLGGIGVLQGRGGGNGSACKELYRSI